jgi:hypothetical protein
VIVAALIAAEIAFSMVLLVSASLRPVFLILRNRATAATQRVPVPSDARRWMPSQSTTFRVTATVAPGYYDILLHLPDAAASLSDRPEYADRFANPGVWEEATRYTFGAIGLRMGASYPAMSIAFTRVLSGMLFGVSTTDPATGCAVVVGVLGVAAEAAPVPEIRAARAFGSV